MSTNLRIGIICHNSLGGSSHSAIRLANTLSKRGHSIYLITLGATYWQPVSSVFQCICETQHRIPQTALYLNWSTEDKNNFKTMLGKLVRTNDIQILHYHYALPFAAIINELALQLGDKMPYVIGTLHGTDLTRCVKDKVARLELIRCLKSTNILTTVSNYMVALAGKIIPNCGIITLPNFLELEYNFGKKLSQDDVKMTRRPVLVHVSNYRPVKNTIAIGEIFSKVCKHIDAELWLIGDGPDLDKLIDSVKLDSKNSLIKTFGHTPDIEHLLIQATFILSSSSEESFGLAILEAMAHGVLPVVSAVGGILELVTDNENGILFNLDDLQIPATRILHILKTAEILNIMQQQAVIRAKDFHEPRIIKRYETVYMQALQN